MNYYQNTNCDRCQAFKMWQRGDIQGYALSQQYCNNCNKEDYDTDND